MKGYGFNTISSYNFFYLLSKSGRSSSKGEISANLQIYVHIFSEIHLSLGLETEILPGVVVVDIKNRSTSALSFCSLIAISAASNSLSFWKRLRLMFLNKLNLK